LEKNQNKINYVAQLIINQILSDEIRREKKNAIVIDKNDKKKKSKKGLVSRVRKAKSS
jgi:hypothetical protein